MSGFDNSALNLMSFESSGESGSNYDDLKFATKKGNMLLEDIVYQVMDMHSKSQLGMFMEVYDQCMTLFFIFMTVAAFFLVLTFVLLYFNKGPVANAACSKVETEEQDWKKEPKDHFLRVVNKSPLKPIDEITINLNEKLL